MAEPRKREIWLTSDRRSSWKHQCWQTEERQISADTTQQTLVTDRVPQIGRGFTKNTPEAMALGTMTGQLVRRADFRWENGFCKAGKARW